MFFDDLRWLTEFTRGIMLYPALSVMVFLRRDIGFRLLRPFFLILITGFLILLGALYRYGHPERNADDLLAFALCFLCLGTYQRAKRWRQFQRGILQHSHYIGTSPFDLRWLPVFLRRNRRIARFIDPIFCGIIGVSLIEVSPLLACWLMISAACLRCFEYNVYCKELNREFDMLDGMVLSQGHSQTVEYFEPPPATLHQVPTLVVPTGIGVDIEQQIKRRRK